MANKGKRSLTLEDKIEEYKAFLRDYQCLMGHEWLEQIGGIATIDRQLIMIDALVKVAQAELQQNYNAHTLATYLYAVFTMVRDNRVTTDSRVVAVEDEYERRGGTHLNKKHFHYHTPTLYLPMCAYAVPARGKARRPALLALFRPERRDQTP